MSYRGSEYDYNYVVFCDAPGCEETFSYSVTLNQTTTGYLPYGWTTRSIPLVPNRALHICPRHRHLNLDHMQLKSDHMQLKHLVPDPTQPNLKELAKTMVPPSVEDNGFFDDSTMPDPMETQAQAIRNVVKLLEEANKTTEEIRSVSSTGAEKGVKPENFALIPIEPLLALARHYNRGAQKYAEHNWRKGFEWSKAYNALMRHLTAFWMGEDIDEETGSRHITAVAFWAMTLFVFMDEQKDFDDRYRPSKEESGGE